jgi:hypothetical protein
VVPETRTRTASRIRRPRLGPDRSAAAVPGLDVGLVAIGLLVWQLVNFLYADIGGPTTVLTAIALGLAAWWAFSPAAVRGERCGRGEGAVP